VRKIYTETLVRRGGYLDRGGRSGVESDFNERLQNVLDEVRTVPVPS